MNVTLTIEGAAPVATTLQAFLAHNADAITSGEGRKIRASLLQHGNAVMIGGGAAPLVELRRADLTADLLAKYPELDRAPTD